MSKWIPNIEKKATEGAVLLGLLGHGISSSRTPRMHINEGQAQGIDIDYRLLDFAGRTDEPPLNEVLDKIQAAGFNGINVTFPYKQSVLPHLDVLSESVRAIGATNTIVFRDGERHGHNTDSWGFGESFRRGMANTIRDKVLLIGAGGAGSAVANALAMENIGQLLICDTNTNAAERLAHALNHSFGADRACAVTDLPDAAHHANGIVNATPIGMEKLPGLPLPTECIQAHHWVADVVYFPLETELLAAARAKGCRVLSGAGMALFQAVRAFEHFTNLPANPTRMQATFDHWPSGLNDGGR
ncbi:shikimate dehydrogenase [Falsihalocynthiibacter sp. S25ZX9]|uniref:shikimate dehydrogenase n=1 Tax=Falsihalocynthiibacter sp. S25ZX9 TaxID=3240870 RepID=UPI0035100E36